MINEEFRRGLAKKIMRGKEGQALKKYWQGSKPFGYVLRNDRDPKLLDRKGEPVRYGTVLEIDPKQAKLVKAIFEEYVAGASCLHIAQDLNARKIASPGATWHLKKRHTSGNGWLTSSVRCILTNRLYRGWQRWNTSKFEKDPDTGAKVRRQRPKEEWIEWEMPKLRIVSDQLFTLAQNRTKSLTEPGATNPAGGKAKYP